ncbi:hypothetical protein BaRGS_00024397 [Batillaria attramentaria]|uniref:MRN complex-interacting protein N-terminal domain-containing protein n=1 Tax=Batillaria attramentaria TaxID=370345 RepID=A0ABD0KBD1_9CAEN
MPEFHALQCFSCQTFQVHQEGKAKKWTCKMCGEKQSIIKVYGRGSGKDCRLHVQKLNQHRGQQKELQESTVFVYQNQHIPQTEASDCKDYDSPPLENMQGSKWSTFLEAADSGPQCEQVDEEEEDNECGGVFTTDRRKFDASRTKGKRAPRSVVSSTSAKRQRQNGFGELQHGASEQSTPFTQLALQKERHTSPGSLPSPKVNHGSHAGFGFDSGASGTWRKTGTRNSTVTRNRPDDEGVFTDRACTGTLKQEKLSLSWDKDTYNNRQLIKQCSSAESRHGGHSTGSLSGKLSASGETGNGYTTHSLINGSPQAKMPQTDGRTRVTHSAHSVVQTKGFGQKSFNQPAANFKVPSSAGFASGAKSKWDAFVDDEQNSGSDENDEDGDTDIAALLSGVDRGDDVVTADREAGVGLSSGKRNYFSQGECDQEALVDSHCQYDQHESECSSSPTNGRNSYNTNQTKMLSSTSSATRTSFSRTQFELKQCEQTQQVRSMARSGSAVAEGDLSVGLNSTTAEQSKKLFQVSDELFDEEDFFL